MGKIHDATPMLDSSNDGGLAEGLGSIAMLVLGFVVGLLVIAAIVGA
jgi:hypothetical protein